MRYKSHSLKEQLWTRYHWRRWDEETPRDRLAYEQKIEDRDNALVMGHIRGKRPLNIARRNAKYGG